MRHLGRGSQGPFDGAGMWTDGDHIATLQLTDITFDWEGAGVFRCVEENGSDFAAKDDAAGSLVGYVRDIGSYVPKHRIDC